jgi:hypothetical protein
MTLALVDVTFHVVLSFLSVRAVRARMGLCFVFIGGFP